MRRVIHASHRTAGHSRRKAGPPRGAAGLPVARRHDHRPASGGDPSYPPPLMADTALPLDCLIFGGGVAGLWTLDELTRRGANALLIEVHELGSGQSVSSQGILHGGFKYTLRGMLTAAAEAIAEMPPLWRACLEGTAEPSLRATRVVGEHCHLWQTRSLASTLGMIGARAGLRVAPTLLEPEERPPALRRCPGKVARIDEQVIDPVSLIRDLSSRHLERIIKCEPEGGIEFDLAAPGEVRRVTLTRAQGASIALAPRCVLLAAGAGNERLRTQVGLGADAAQRRPLHMAMARGALPVLHGHCVDGAHTRVTITSASCPVRGTIWQLGGQLSEDGVRLDERTLQQRAAEEIADVLPGIDLSRVEWSSYRVDRAERRTGGGVRPDDAQLLEDGGNVITAWPTKLVLAPRLAQLVAGRVDGGGVAERPHPNSGARDAERRATIEGLADWTRPNVAKAPWDQPLSWSRL